MSGGFKRSGLFGLVGVVVVMIAVALIALSADSSDPNPKGTMALIFGVIAVFVVILFVLQRSDLEKVAGGDAKAVQRAVAEAGGKIENPTTMEEQQRRRSQKLGGVVMALILLTVPPIYLLESFVPLLIGGPLIAIAAIYGSVRALAPGGSSEVTVREPCHEFSAKSKRVKVASGTEGIVIARKGGAQADWLCDLWLAERLADAA